MAFYQTRPGAPGGFGVGAPGQPLWTKGKVAAPPPAVGKAAAVATKMPGPTKDQDSREVHIVDWPLYTSNGPVVNEVKQAPNLANCPVAAILAAMAHTPDGKVMIQRMISTTAAKATTDISTAGELANPHPNKIMTSDRYFTVTIGGKSVVVTDVLYTDDHDRGWSPFYMRDKNDNCIWAAVIEKGLAAHLGSYEQIDAMGIDANTFFEKIIGSKPKGIAIDAKTSVETIRNAARVAGRVPTIAASQDDTTKVKAPKISSFHGFAVLGLQGGNIKIHDPALVKPEVISPEDFKLAFKAMLWM